MPWISRHLRGQRIWARIKSDGTLAAGSDGRIDVLYRKGGKVYRAAARNLEPDDEAEEIWSDADAAPGGGAREQAAPSEPPPVDAIQIWADGACSGNPGPAGIGIVILDGKKRDEVSEYLGSATNNIAEVTAIIRALESVPRDRVVVLHSDSAYALGLLGKGWKAKANQELVDRMKRLASEFGDLRLVKVLGHSGIPENERADALARQAVLSGSSPEPVRRTPPDPVLPPPPRRKDPF